MTICCLLPTSASVSSKYDWIARMMRPRKNSSSKIRHACAGVRAACKSSSRADSSGQCASRIAEPGVPAVQLGFDPAASSAPFVATIVDGWSSLLRRLQSGSVRAYAGSLFIGVVLILGYYLWR